MLLFPNIDEELVAGLPLDRSRLDEAITKKCAKTFLQLCQHVESLKGGLAYQMLFQWLPFPADDIEAYGKAFDLVVHSAVKALGPAKVVHTIAHLVDRDAKLNGENYWTHAHRAHIALASDPYSMSAYLNYALAAGKSRGMDLYDLTHGIDGMRPYFGRDCIFASGKSWAPSITENVTNVTFAQPKFVHILSCDGLYLNRFASRLLESYPDTARSDVLCLTHLINPSADDIKAAKELMAIVPNLRIDVETINLEGLSFNWRRSYFASARFHRVPRALEQFAVPVIVTDVDVEVGETFANATDLIEGYDFGLSAGIASMQSYYPWMRASAGLAVFSANERSREYAFLVSHYINQAMNRSPLSHNWGIDQTALWASLMYMRTKYGQQDFARLRLNMLTRDQKGRY